MSAEHHLDILGREVKVDDHVAFTHHNSLVIGTVTKVTPKMVHVIPMFRKNSSGYLKYTAQCCLVGGPELTALILTKS